MTASRGPRRRSERRLVDMSPPPEPSWTPDLTQCQSERYVLPVVGDNGRVAVRYERDGNKQLVDFAMVQQPRLGEREDDWADVLKVDCDHGEVHVHRYNLGGEVSSRTTHRPIHGPEDVAAGCDYAERLIYERWDENVRRWERGR